MERYQIVYTKAFHRLLRALATKKKVVEQIRGGIGDRIQPRK